MKKAINKMKFFSMPRKSPIDELLSITSIERRLISNFSESYIYKTRGKVLIIIWAKRHKTKVTNYEEKWK